MIRYEIKMRCGQVVPIDKDGIANTYCMQPLGHGGNHDQVLQQDMLPSGHGGSEKVLQMPAFQRDLYDPFAATRCPHGYVNKGNCSTCRS